MAPQFAVAWNNLGYHRFRTRTSRWPNSVSVALRRIGAYEPLVNLGACWSRA
jgi:hypothetical protein